MIFESKKVQNLPSYRNLKVALTTIYLRSLLKDLTIKYFE
jgi:hypothetical protein